MFYASFGTGQPLKNYYVKIQAESEEEARIVMSATFGSCWAFIYKEKNEYMKSQNEIFINACECLSYCKSKINY